MMLITSGTGPKTNKASSLKISLTNLLTHSIDQLANLSMRVEFLSIFREIVLFVFFHL